VATKQLTVVTNLPADLFNFNISP